MSKLFAFLILSLSGAALADTPVIDPTNLPPLLAPAGYDGGLGGICGHKAVVNVYAMSKDVVTGTIHGELKATNYCQGSGRDPITHTYTHWDSVSWDPVAYTPTVLPYDGGVPETGGNDVLVLVPYYTYKVACWGDLDGNLLQVNSCYALAGAHAWDPQIINKPQHARIINVP